MSNLPEPLLYVWRMGARPVLAYAGGTRGGACRALTLFPRSSSRRRWLYAGIRTFARVGLDRFFAERTRSAGPLLEMAEIDGLLDAVRRAGASPGDWLLLWPARIERARLYLLFRDVATAQNGVIKMGAGPENARLLRNEADALRRLAGQSHPFQIPSVLVIQALSGDRTLLALGGFPARLHTPRRHAATMWSERVLAHLACLEPAGMIHGDLGPGNMSLTDDGGLFLFDWEHSAVGQDALMDRVGFWLSLRQRQILRHPGRLANQFKQDFHSYSESDRIRGIEYLAARDNLAAQIIRETWL